MADDPSLCDRLAMLEHWRESPDHLSDLLQELASMLVAFGGGLGNDLTSPRPHTMELLARAMADVHAVHRQAVGMVDGGDIGGAAVVMAHLMQIVGMMVPLMASLDPAGALAEMERNSA